MFTMIVYTFLFNYCKKQKEERTIVKLHFRTSKNGDIYRRHKILYDKNGQVELVFNGLIKASVRHDFIFYPSMKEVGKFEDI